MSLLHAPALGLWGVPLNHFRTGRSIRSNLFLAARAWTYFEPEPLFSLLLRGVPNLSRADVVDVVVVGVVVVGVVAISGPDILRSPNSANSADSAARGSNPPGDLIKRYVGSGLAIATLRTRTPPPTTPAAASSHAQSTILAGCRPDRAPAPQPAPPPPCGAAPIRSPAREAAARSSAGTDQTTSFIRSKS